MGERSTTILIIFMFLMTGCTKFLTHDDPAGVTDDKWWNTEQDANNALNIIYAHIPPGTRGARVMFWSSLSDESVARWGEYDNYVKGLQDSKWDVSKNMWSGDYLSIRRANRFMEHVDHVFIDSLLKKRMKFEARALRAYYHMQLLLFFGAIPIIDHSLTPNENQKPRDSVPKVYQFVVSELQVCADSLPKEYDNVDNWRISSGICRALICRLALDFHQYDLIKKAATKIINSEVYELYQSSDPGANSYAELFSYKGELNKERIFFSRNGSSNA